MNLNVLKWHARRKLRPLLRPICWLTKHRRGVLKHNFPAPMQGDLDVRMKVFECPRCLRTTRYVDKAKPVAQTSPADGSPHYSESSTGWTTIQVPPSTSAVRAYREAELKKLRGET